MLGNPSCHTDEIFRFSAFIYECKRELLIRKSRPSVPPSHADIVVKTAKRIVDILPPPLIAYQSSFLRSSVRNWARSPNEGCSTGGMWKTRCILKNGDKQRTYDCRLYQNRMSSIKTRTAQWPWVTYQGHLVHFKVIDCQNLQKTSRTYPSRMISSNVLISVQWFVIHLQ